MRADGWAAQGRPRRLSRRATLVVGHVPAARGAAQAGRAVSSPRAPLAHGALANPERRGDVLPLPALLLQLPGAQAAPLDPVPRSIRRRLHAAHCTAATAPASRDRAAVS